MLCLFFASFVLSTYVELTSENADEHIGGETPLVVKFYSPDCPHCQAMAEDYDQLTEAFRRVSFGAVNCDKEKQLCEAHKVDGYPTVLLFKAGSKQGIEFEGSHVFDDMCDFVENYTRFKARRAPSYVVDLNPGSFERRVNESACALVTFFAPWCGHCQQFLPELAIAAEAFIPDTNITLARVNCDQFGEMCSQFGVDGYPTILLLKPQQEDAIPFEGEHFSESIVEFINDECGTQREVGGLLNSQAGVIPEADDIVGEFLTGNKEEALAKMRALPGAEFYVRVMERYMQKGKEQIEKDVKTMRGFLDERKGSWQSLDGMKRRYNVFEKFVDKEEEPRLPESEYIDDDDEI